MYSNWIVLIFLVIGLFVYVKYLNNSLTENFEQGRLEQQNFSKCTPKQGCEKNKDLLPITNPLFNMREVCKQCILLEDHLFQTKKRCEDCIKKHCLTIEGLAEEAITLDKENKYALDKLGLPDKFREIQKCYIKGEDPITLAQKIRQLRKPLMNKYFDKF
jgi:hypothetical protein